MRLDRQIMEEAYISDGASDMSSYSRLAKLHCASSVRTVETDHPLITQQSGEDETRFASSRNRTYSVLQTEEAVFNRAKILRRFKINLAWRLRWAAHKNQHMRRGANKVERQALHGALAW